MALVLGVFSQLTGHGGVPYAGRQAAAVLWSFARDRGLACRIMGLNDPADTLEARVGDTSFEISGFQRSKVRLAKEVLAAGAWARLAYFGHVSLSPLALVLRFWPRARYIVAGHGIEVWQPLSPLVRIALRNANSITAPSQYTAHKIHSRNNLDPSQVRVLPWGLDPSFQDRTLCNKDRPSLPGRVLLTVARLAATERNKGIESVIRAMPAVLRSVPDAYYVIVGDGDDRLRLEHVAHETGVAARTIFPGRRTDQEVAAYHSIADVYVMPSRKEGLGLVFLEAMACGKPVVAAAEAAAPEVVTEGETGFLVGYGDVEALAERVSLLLLDRQLRKQMGAAGRLRFEQNYSFARFNSGLSALLSKGLAEPFDATAEIARI